MVTAVVFKWSFRLHEKRGFEKQSVSCRREHHFFSEFGPSAFDQPEVARISLQRCVIKFRLQALRNDFRSSLRPPG